MLPKSFGIWKVRATPRAAISWGRSRSTRRPARWISPASRRWSPESVLMVVVLPEPLGPMSPRISPRRMARESPSTATTPPKRLTTPRVSRAGGSAAPAAAPVVIGGSASGRPPRQRGLVHLDAPARALQREDAAVRVPDRRPGDVAGQQERAEEL